MNLELPMDGLIIGQGSLAEHCAEHWLAAGHTVALCCSQDGSLERWARRRGVAHVRSVRELERRLAADDTEVDVLWSLNNPSILRRDLIARARRYAINYHDSPLPKYAGLFATTWALADGMREHAITFHVLEPGIDTGDIVKQRPVVVDAADTAQTLNLRCFERACEAFAELVDELASECVRRLPQPHPEAEGLAHRGSYFGHADRPLPACVLDLEASETRLQACARALDFGDADNPVGSLRLLSQSAVGPAGSSIRATRIVGLRFCDASPAGFGRVGVGRVARVDRDQGRLVVQAEHGQWHLRTAPHDTVLPAEGDRVLSPGTAAVARDTLVALQGAASKAEARWVRRVATAGSAQHPRLQTDAQAGAAAPQAGDLAEPPGRLRRSVAGGPSRSRRLAELLAFFGRFHPESIGHLQLLDPSHPGWSADAPASDDASNLHRQLRAALLSERVPLALALRRGQSFATFMDRVRVWLDQMQRDGGYLFDLHARHPTLPPLPTGAGVVSVRLAEAPTADETSGLVIDIDREGALTFEFTAGQAAVEAVALVADFEAFCQQLAGAPEDQCLTEVPLMDAGTWQRVIVDWNRTEVTRAGPTTVCEAFTQAAAHHADKVALIDPTGDAPLELTYAALNAESTAVARALRDRGVVDGQLVGVHIERCAAQLVTVLGVLKAGAAYLPLDPTYPSERTRQVIELAKPACIVTLDAQAAASSPLKRKTYTYDALLNAGHASTATLPTVAPGALAYAIFTSGSTGVPKGVPIQHASLLNHAQTFSDRMRLAPGGRVLQSASLSFDVGAEQIFPALLSGATLVLRTPHLLESFGELSRFISGHGITVMSLPTGLWQAWLGHLARTGAAVPACLRVVGTGTEKVQTWALAEWRRRAPAGCRWFQGYGPTETTITCVAHEDEGAAVPALGVPIGRPLPNVQAFVVDAHLQPVPVGCPGELLIGGAGLSPGYLGNPEETARRFIVTDHLGRRGLRVYRTGDLVVQDAAGQLTFLGRRDNQVKIAGYRVELGDIEGHIAELAVVDAVAVVVTGDGDGRQLVAHIAGQGGDSDAALVAAVLAHTRTKLPAFMVPASVMVHESLPTLANGKTDRRTLAQLRPTAPATQEAANGNAATPRATPDNASELRPSSLEGALADLWKACLDVDTVAPQDDFFELGGTSLTAVRLCSDIEHALQTQLSLGQVFQHRSLRAMAACLEAELEHSTRDAAVAFPLCEAEDPETAPLFLFCGIFVYDKLARQLSGKRPCVAFSIPAEQQAFSDTRALGHPDGATIEALAADYVREIRKRQPHGPYHLVGLSAGGVIAYEAARQLTAAGAQVGLVSALDTILPSALEMTPGRRLRAWSRELMEIGPWQLATRVAQGVVHRIARAMPPLVTARPSRLPSGIAVADETAAIAPDPEGVDIKRVHDDYRTHRTKALRTLVGTYAATPRPLRVVAGPSRRGRRHDATGGPRFVLFNARQSPWHRHSPRDLGFAPWVAHRQEVIDVDCGHMDLVNGPEVAQVAEALHRAAADVEAGPQRQRSSSFPLPSVSAPPALPA